MIFFLCRKLEEEHIRCVENVFTKDQERSMQLRYVIRMPLANLVQFYS